MRDDYQLARSYDDDYEYYQEGEDATYSYRDNDPAFQDRNWREDYHFDDDSYYEEYH